MKSISIKKAIKKAEHIKETIQGKINQIEPMNEYKYVRVSLRAMK